jgi:imidazolonepropionase-like amidohydrolase
MPGAHGCALAFVHGGDASDAPHDRDFDYLLLLAARMSEMTLMQGFTTVRDLGGPVFGLERAIHGTRRIDARTTITPSSKDPAKNFLVIMKDGMIYKNRLPK